jgi:TATA-box binding protein (TBP) (component of TFIID and TFIIIB)
MNGLSKFDNIIKTECLGEIDKNSGVKYSSINISTMTVCFNFNQVLDLNNLKNNLPEKLNVNYNPGSKKSKIPKKKGTDSFYNSFDIKLVIVDYISDPVIFSNVSIFIFPNGKVKVAGAKTINTINIMIDELIDLIKYIPNTVQEPKNLNIENVKIQMICSDFKIKPIKPDPDGWCLKQEILKNILVNDYSLSATFSSMSRYPGINLKVKSLIDEKNISLLIFRSGSIIITGAKYIEDICNCYKFINKVICKNSEKLFYYDINEDIKQKKKNQVNK